MAVAISAHVGVRDAEMMANRVSSVDNQNRWLAFMELPVCTRNEGERYGMTASGEPAAIAASRTPL